MDGNWTSFSTRSGAAHTVTTRTPHLRGPAPGLVAPTVVPAGLWDDPPEATVDPIFQEIVELARLLTGAEAAAFSVLDHERVWLRACVGVSTCSLPQAAAISAYAVHRGDVLEIVDTHAFLALADHPLVRGAYEGMPALRSYAAVQLYSAPPERIYVGTLSVFGTRPHTLSDDACAGLVDLAHHLQGHLHAREHARRDLETGFYRASVMGGLVQHAIRRALLYGGGLSLVGIVPERPLASPAARRQYAGRIADMLLGHGELAGEPAIDTDSSGMDPAPDGWVLLLLPGSAPVHAEAIAEELRGSLALPGLADAAGRPIRFGLGVAGHVWKTCGVGPGADARAGAEAATLAASLVARAMEGALAELALPTSSP